MHFRETRDENLLKAVHYQFEDLPVSLDFLPTSLFIATWENVTGGFASSGLVCNNKQLAQPALLKMSSYSSTLMCQNWDNGLIY